MPGRSLQTALNRQSLQFFTLHLGYFSGGNAILGKEAALIDSHPCSGDAGS